METLKLIALWSEDSTQTMLEGCKRTKVVFLKLEKPMEAAGIQKKVGLLAIRIRLIIAISFHPSFTSIGEL